jgi:hypothetical protein
LRRKLGREFGKNVAHSVGWYRANYQQLAFDCFVDGLRDFDTGREQNPGKVTAVFPSLDYFVEAIGAMAPERDTLSLIGKNFS